MLRQRNSQAWRRFGFWWFYPSVYSLVFVLIEKVYQTLETVFHRLSKASQISSKILCSASYFQLSSPCLDIPMKHCLSSLIYYMKNSKGYRTWKWLLLMICKKLKKEWQLTNNITTQWVSTKKMPRIFSKTTTQWGHPVWIPWALNNSYKKLGKFGFALRSTQLVMITWA